MYQPGDLIIYGGEGVCRVESVGPLALSDVKSDKLYYTLQPLYRNETVFAPVEGKVFMRPVIGREEAEALVRSIPEIRENRLENRNMRAAGEYYQKMMDSHDCADLVQLIKSIYVKQQSAQAAGRKGGQVDERYRKRAEETLYGELAVALEIPRDKVEAYIYKVIEEEKAAR